MRRSVRLAPAAVLLVLAAGCTGGPGSDSASTTPSGAGSSPAAPSSVSPSDGASATSPAPTASRAATPPAPSDEACYRMSSADLAKPTSSARPVSCRSKHDAQTIFVGKLDTVLDGHAVAVDSDQVQEQLADTCPGKLARHVGGSTDTRRLSRLHVVWFSPTLEQSDEGAEWFRCDLIAFAGEKALYPLPRKGKLHGVLDGDGALDTYGLCGTAAPGEKGFGRVICDRKHSWRAIHTIDLSGGRKYPGVASVRKGGEAACKDRARAQSENSLKFRYGWEWPTRDQWKRGQHFGYCWVPD